MRQAVTLSPTSSPTKTNRSPKKATFSFNLKNILRLNRHDRSKRLREDMSPIRTLKRAGRSMSDPMLATKRMHEFEEEEEKFNETNVNDEEINTIMEQEQRDANDVQEEEDEEKANVSNTKDGEINAIRKKEQVVANHASSALDSTYSIAAVSSDVLHGTCAAQSLADKQVECEQFVSNVLGEHHELQDRDAETLIDHVARSGNQDERIACGAGFEISNSVANIRDQEYAKQFEAVAVDLNESAGTQLQAGIWIEFLACQTDAEVRHGRAERATGFVESTSEDDEETKPPIADSNVSLPIKRNFNQHKELSSEVLTFGLDLYTIFEEEECEENNLQLNGDCETILTTTTHHIRVGTLPGSPIRSPVRLMSIFEENEVMYDDKSDDIYMEDSIESQPGDLHFESDDADSTDNNAELLDSFQAVGDEDGSSSTLATTSELDSTVTPSFTPTSPVELRGSQDAGTWFPPHQADFLDYFEDGDSTWTNCSSYEGDSGIGPLVVGAAFDHSVEGIGRDDVVFANEELMFELEEAEVRLGAAILVVGEAINLASQSLISLNDGNAENFGALQVVSYDGMRGDESVSTPFGHEDDGSDQDLVQDKSLSESEQETPIISLGTLVMTPLSATGNEESKIDNDTNQQPWPFNHSQSERETVSEINPRPPSTSPFAEIYNSNDSHGSETIGDSFAPTHRSGFHDDQGETNVVSAASSRVGETVGDLGSSIRPQPINEKIKSVEVGRSATSPVLLALWLLVVTGVALFALSLTDIRDVRPRFGTDSASSLCHEVWHSIAATYEISAIIAPDRDAMYHMKSFELDQTLPTLLESDVITACEFVVQMHIEKELMDALTGDYCGLLGDDIQSGCITDEEIQFRWKRDRAEDVGHLNHYLLGLAFTLLVVAFLEYDRQL